MFAQQRKLDGTSLSVVRVWTATLYLRLEALNQDGHQQVEEDVVAKGHERDEVESCYGRGGGHAII